MFCKDAESELRGEAVAMVAILERRGAYEKQVEKRSEPYVRTR